MTEAERLAEFVDRMSYDDISEEAREQLKIRVLDSLACAIGAVGGDPIRRIRKHIEDFGGSRHCTLIGGGRAAPDRAGFYNSALVRYLDFNDSYLAKGETCHRGLLWLKLQQTCQNCFREGIQLAHLLHRR